MSRCSIQIECVSIKTSFDKVKCILVSSVTEVLWYWLKRLHFNILLYGLINIGYFYYYLCILNNVNIISRCAREIIYITMVQINTERPFTVLCLHSGITRLFLVIPTWPYHNRKWLTLWLNHYSLRFTCLLLAHDVVKVWSVIKKNQGYSPKGKYGSFVLFQVTKAIKSLNWDTEKLVL